MSWLDKDEKVARTLLLPDTSTIIPQWGGKTFRAVVLKESAYPGGYSVWAGGPLQSVKGGDCASRLGGELWSVSDHFPDRSDLSRIPEPLRRYLVGRDALAALLPRAES